MGKCTEKMLLSMLTMMLLSMMLMMMRKEEGRPCRVEAREGFARKCLARLR